MPFSGCAIAQQAGVHARQLLRSRVGLVAGFPFGGGQPVDHLARGRFAQRRAGLDDPVGQTIAAEAREAHQIDVLRIVAVAQVPHQMAERGSGLRIGQGVERIGPHVSGRIRG